MTQKLLGIERKLDITITMPQICHFCGEEITKKFGKVSESLCFHSLDGNHDNWDPTNKVPAHFGCHVKYHRTGAHLPFVPGVLKKKVIEFSGTKLVILPKPWYTDIKRRYGKELVKVYLDVNNNEIRITPNWEDEE